MRPRNDCERGLLGGSIGQSVALGDHPFIDFDGEKYELGSVDANGLVRAYGITVHRVQGSQFERVVVSVFGDRFLDRTMIYAAVARIAKQVVLVGDRQAFEGAVQAPLQSLLRKAGMLMHLDAFLNGGASASGSNRRGL